MTNFNNLRYIFVFVFVGFWQFLLSQDQCAFNEIPPNEIGVYCQTAQFMCGAQLDGFTGKLTDKYDGTDQPDPLCNGDGTAENMFWIAFIPCEETVSIQITPGNCENFQFPGNVGIQAGIYTDCTFSEAIVCASEMVETPVWVGGNTFIPGQVYYLYIDGFSASVCEFTIDIITGIDTNPVEIESTGVMEVLGDTDICTDGFAAHTYIVEGECDITGGSSCSNPSDYLAGLGVNWLCYQWTITPNFGWAINGDQNASTIDIVWEEPGNYNVEVEIVYNPQLGDVGGECYYGAGCPINSLEVNISEPDVIKDEVYLCAGDSVEFCGQTYFETGIYDCIDYDACLHQVLIVEEKTDSITNLGNIFLCPSECLTIEGEVFCDDGDYEFVSNTSCNIIYQFSIKPMSMTVDVIGLEELDCDTDIVSLTANLISDYEGQIEYEWFFQGNIDGTGSVYNTSEPGTYTLMAYAVGQKSDCFDTYNFTIKENYEQPQVELTGGTLDCDISTLPILLNSQIDIATTDWTGKNNFFSDELEPMIVDSGTYHVLVTATNGCTNEASIFINANYPKANLEIDYQDLNCAIPQTLLSYVIDVEVDSFVWIGPEAKKYFEKNPLIKTPGNYELRVFSENGCDYSELFQILADFEEPEMAFSTPDEWGCKTQSISVDLEYLNDTDYEVEWYTSDGKIINNPTTLQLQAGTIGMYYVELTNTENFCSVVDSIEIVTDGNIPEKVEIEVEDPLCFGFDTGVIDIRSVEGGESPYSYMVNGQLQDNTYIENLSGGVYQLQVMDANGCTLTKDVVINGPIQIEGELDGPYQADYKDIVSFYALVDIDLYDIREINWYNEANEYIGSGEDVNFIMLHNENITMELIDENGCIVIRTAPVLLNTDFKFFTPNIFSPNGDGKNDRFNLFSEDLPIDSYSLDIFDRWGNNVYSNEELLMNDSSDGWDGHIHGKDAQSGVYTFLARIDVLGTIKELTGTVSLIR